MKLARFAVAAVVVGSVLVLGFAFERELGAVQPAGTLRETALPVAAQSPQREPTALLHSPIRPTTFALSTASPRPIDTRPTAAPPAQPDGLPPGVQYAANTDAVRIETIELSSSDVRTGDMITGRVKTTSNAASVTAQIGSIVIAVPKVAPGTFSLTIRAPAIPFAPDKVDVVVKAYRTDGATDTRTVPVGLKQP